MLGAVGGDEIEGHMGRTTDVFIRKSPTGALVASTHHTLADKISSPDDEDEQDDSNDWTDGVRPSVRNATRGRRHILYTWGKKDKDAELWAYLGEILENSAHAHVYFNVLPQASSSDPSGQSE